VVGQSRKRAKLGLEVQILIFLVSKSIVLGIIFNYLGSTIDCRVCLLIVHQGEDIIQCVIFDPCNL
jgi:hypothetical protein